MVNLNHNNDNNTSKNVAQFIANPKYNQVNFYKNGAKRYNLGPLGSDSNEILRIYHQKICGLGSKSNDLLVSLYPKLPHILCLTEHHLRQLQLQHITVDNYILGAAYSRQSLHKGGVCIFIQKHLPFSIINIEKFCKDKELEACALKLNFLSFKICVITVYRSPNSDFQYFIKELDKIINKIYKPGVNLIICGDININYLIESKEKHELNNILNSYNLTSIIDFPTRTKDNSSTLIDNIFLDKSNLGMYTTCSVVNGLSDHDAQMLELHAGNLINNTNKYKTSTIRKFDSNTINEFKDKLSSELWQNVFANDNNDVNSIFNSFLNIYLQIFYSCFPKVSSNRTSTKNQWITKGIMNSCKRKKELFLLTRKSNNIKLREYYKRYSKTLSHVIRTAKILHYNNQILHSDNTVKATWKIIKRETGGNNTKYDNINTLNSDKEHNKSPNAENFNKYFSTVAENISCKIKGSNKLTLSHAKGSLSCLSPVFNRPFNNIVFCNTSTGEIEKIIQSLPGKNSCGYDEISTRILKASAPFISSPLCCIINTSLNSGVFPTRLKYSVITPLHKKGDKNNVSNYRPISVLTSFSKIFERIIYNRLITHFTSHKILANSQFGFRKKSSTDKAAYKLINDILSALNNKQIVGGMFFDLEKAFDCVNHNILLAKLEYYGIRGVMFTLIKSYLEDRYQRVKFNNRLSNWDKINIGVPQGSILGPLLFLIYVNDLPSVIPCTLADNNSSIILFADDTSVIINDPCLMNLERNLNINFRIVNEWFNSNFLSLNLDKTYYMQFVTKTKFFDNINVEYDKKLITQANFVKFLGITVDSTLSWKQHIDAIIPKLNKACYIIRRLKLYLSNTALKMVYYAFFHSVMSYGLIFWGNSTNSKCVFKLQKRAVRIIMGAKNNDSCREFFKLLKILPLYAQYIYSLLMFVVNNRNLFLGNADLYSKQTRNSHNLHLPLPQLTKYKKGVHYAGIWLFNHLPNSIKNTANETKMFKKTLKKFLRDNSFYTVDEFINFRE